MNTKNNKRRRVSRERIKSIFLEMLQEKELHEITVSDICKLSGLNRSTFYANYMDIYDLADSIRESLEAEVSRLYETEALQNFNSNDYLKLFRHIKDNQLFYRTYFKLGYDSQINVTKYDIHLAEWDFENKNIAYHIEFFKSGLNAIIKMWLAGGCKETPEEMKTILDSEYKGRTSMNKKP